MSKQYTLPEDEAPKMAGEPAAAYAMPQNHHKMYFEVTSNQAIAEDEDD